MTDKEIIKALECWVKNFDGKATDYITLCNTLDLINRQQAEIERLQKNSKKVLETCSRVIKANDERNNEIFQGAIEVVRAEAIKEFARALRQQAFDRLYVSIDEIDNLVKEMAGDDK